MRPKQQNFFSFIFRFSICILISCALISCAQGGGGSDDDDNSEPTPIDSGSPAVQLSTECGVLVKGSLENPVSSADAEQVEVVSVASSNSVIVRRTGAVQGDILVKLHGIGESSRPAATIDALELLAQGSAYYIPAIPTSDSAADSCIVDVPGGLAATGQLFTLSGVSYSESLIRSGVAGEIDPVGACGEERVRACYSQLREANTARCAGQITDFLWKPISESGFNEGNPVILVNPCDATVIVNGQSLMDFGPGNGRCNTSRMFSSCGSFGSNIRVEVIDNATGVPYCNGNDPFVIVPNGCDRFEFKR
jgi:hypothetical protein